MFRIAVYVTTGPGVSSTPVMMFLDEGYLMFAKRLDVTDDFPCERKQDVTKVFLLTNEVMINRESNMQ